MTTTTVHSESKTNVSYTLVINSQGQAANCNCPSRKYNQKTPCKHMTSYQPVEQRNSCCLCGRDTKQVVCGRCLGD
jgi:hypothetical protein